MNTVPGPQLRSKGFSLFIFQFEEENPCERGCLKPPRGFTTDQEQFPCSGVRELEISMTEVPLWEKLFGD